MAFAKYNKQADLDLLIWEGNDQRRMVSEMISANDIDSMKKLLSLRCVYNEHVYWCDLTTTPTAYQGALLFVLEFNSLPINQDRGFSNAISELASLSPMVPVLAVRYLIEDLSDLSAEEFSEVTSVIDLISLFENEDLPNLCASTMMRLDHSAKSADIFMKYLGPATSATKAAISPKILKSIKSTKAVGERLANSAKRWSNHLHLLCNIDR